MKALRATILAFLLLLVGGILVHHVFQRRQAVFARLTDSESNEVIVIGESADRLDGWMVELCWRRSNGPWMTYLLDGDAGFWHAVELSKLTNCFLVKRQQQLVGKLNTTDGSFAYPAEGSSINRPKDIVVSDNPFDRKNRIYPESPEWSAVWPVTAIGAR